MRLKRRLINDSVTVKKKNDRSLSVYLRNKIYALYGEVQGLHGKVQELLNQ